MPVRPRLAGIEWCKLYLLHAHFLTKSQCALWTLIVSWFSTPSCLNALFKCGELLVGQTVGEVRLHYASFLAPQQGQKALLLRTWAPHDSHSHSTLQQPPFSFLYSIRVQKEFPFSSDKYALQTAICPQAITRSGSPQQEIGYGESPWMPDGSKCSHFKQHSFSLISIFFIFLPFL